jgi:Rab3 GTPase-activating protein catalytic subunit
MWCPTLNFSVFIQVVNLCIDIVTACEEQEQQQHQQVEKRPKLGQTELDSSEFDGYASASSMGEKLDATTDHGNDSDRDLSNNGSDEFSDAFSGEEELLANESAAAVVAAAAKRSIGLQQSRNQHVRRGARCPVAGCSLVANGDQLYAPYLQRPYPLTDDVIAERRMMLSRAQLETTRATDQVIQRRLEISYRLQKPKLLSDMCAFKAANPGSVFQDFINWYGNPGNPLEDYCDMRNSHSRGTTIGDLLLGRASTESVAIKLDKASEATQMLNETREFWSRTWEEARPIAASEQKPLFDVSSTVEMALDYMEQIHPAILINQIMAVNLAVAYFTLMGAAKEVGVLHVKGLLQGTFQRLRDRTEHALELLSMDATKSTSASCSDARHHEGSSSFISLQAISACDAACSALSEAEVLTARATSLLHKFPEQYDLVGSILQHEPGYEITLSNRKAQQQILHAIQQQQQQQQTEAKKPSTASDANPSYVVRPALREYILRNLDDSHPCQLSVRFGDEIAMLNRSKSNNSRAGNQEHASGGGLIIALTKSLAE